MANQWGTGTGDAGERPNWFTDTTTVSRGASANTVVYDRPNHPAEAENLEATAKGWERVVRYTDADGNARTKNEVVVANRELGTDLGAPVVVDIRWAKAHDDAYLAAQFAGIVITFNKPVVVDTSGGTPHAKYTASSSGALTAEYVSGSGTNQLTFTDSTALTGLGGETILVPVDSVVLNSGSISSTAEDGSATATITSTAALGLDAGVRLITA